ncbi:Cof-type HAD-IIB family hydrolase [Pseudothermotoga sp. U03pept]|uniref:Cof-type HAD-IIB family hydrolase n=1 Tax=Pseudothermotoga sp. U03pept TaxID=3447012 RepID=UPI003F04C0C2
MKLLVSDLDGTLLEVDHTVSQGTIQIVQKIEELGIRFTIATGRSLSSCREYIEVLKLTTPVILLNGARIFDPVSKRYLTQHNLSQRATEIVLEIAMQQKNLTTAIFVNEDVYVYNLGLNAATYVIRDALTYRSINDLYVARSWNVTKIVFAGHFYDLNGLEVDLPELIHEEAQVVRSEDDLLEVLPKNANKGFALKELTNILKISLNEVVAVGNGMNDLEMIKTAGLGIAVGKSTEDVKKASKLYIQEIGEIAMKKIYELLKGEWKG